MSSVALVGQVDVAGMVGGALVPLLTLGIPGSAATAVLIFGVFGWMLRRYGFPTAPLVLAVLSFAMPFIRRHKQKQKR